MENPELEIEKLKQTIKLLKRKVRVQNELIAEYQENILIKFYDFIASITDSYSIRLNPPAQELKASFKNQSESFEVKIADVVGVFSDGRTKMIFLNEKINSIGSSERNTNIVFINSGFKILINSLDSVKFHLCQVDKSTFVNVKYYDLKQEEIVCNVNLKNELLAYQVIQVNAKYKAAFIKMKTNFEKIYSLQKVLVDYKLQNGFPI